MLEIFEKGTSNDFNAINKRFFIRDEFTDWVSVIFFSILMVFNFQVSNVYILFIMTTLNRKTPNCVVTGNKLPNLLY